MFRSWVIRVTGYSFRDTPHKNDIMNHDLCKCASQTENAPTKRSDDGGDKFDGDEERDVVDDSKQSGTETAHVRWQQLA